MKNTLASVIVSNHGDCWWKFGNSLRYFNSPGVFHTKLSVCTVLYITLQPSGLFKGHFFWIRGPDENLCHLCCSIFTKRFCVHMGKFKHWLQACQFQQRKSLERHIYEKLSSTLSRIWFLVHQSKFKLSYTPTEFHLKLVFWILK